MKGVTLHHKLKNGQSYAYHFEIMKKQFILLLALVVSFPILATASKKPTPAKRLIQRLSCIQSHGIMFGHQDDTFYGHNWHYETGRSDVLETAGDYPAVMGFDLGGLEIDSPRNLDGVPFADMRSAIIAQQRRGGIVTLSWHPRNFVNGKSSWDPEGGEVTKLFNDKVYRKKLTAALDKVAAFIGSLKMGKTAAPVIFRPWHEMNGDWFWWGGKNTTTEAYRQLYRFTHDYLSRRCRNIAWAFSPNLGATSMDEYYPGDAYVDLVGIDIYDFNNDAKAYTANVSKGLTMVCDFAKAHKKLAALTETGCQGLPQTNEPIEDGNGIYEKYKNPVLTAAHTPLEWRYDFFEQTNPFLEQRIMMEAAFNAGAIKWGDKYVVVTRVEGAESRHTTAMVGAMRVGRGPRQPLSPLRRQAGPGQGPTLLGLHQDPPARSRR